MLYKSLQFILQYKSLNISCRIKLYNPSCCISISAYLWLACLQSMFAMVADPHSANIIFQATHKVIRKEILKLTISLWEIGLTTSKLKDFLIIILSDFVGCLMRWNCTWSNLIHDINTISHSIVFAKVSYLASRNLASL